MMEDYSAQDLLHYNSMKRNSRLSLKELTGKLVQASAIPQVPKVG